MPGRRRLRIGGRPLFASGRMKRLAGRRCRRLEAIKPFPMIFPRPLEQDLDRVLHLIVRSTKRQANSAGGIERREVEGAREDPRSAHREQSQLTACCAWAAEQLNDLGHRSRSTWATMCDAQTRTRAALHAQHCMQRRVRS
jgi:hypothetical protein